MKAAVYSKYGPPEVVAIAEVPKPVPQDNEVLVRIHAATITTADWRARSLEIPVGFGLFGRPAFGFFGPRKKVLGMDMSGTIESMGKDVTNFKIDDPVLAMTRSAFGCHAEYQVIAADGLIVRKPENLSFEQATALAFGGTTALDFLRRKGGIQQGERVLIVGASGCVGSAAVQIAKHFGAHVTGVCSTSNVELVRSIGADKVFDYKKQDYTTSAEKFDIIMDTTGTESFAHCQNSLSDGGKLLLVLASLGQNIGIGSPSRKSSKRAIAGVASERIEDLQSLSDMAANGEFMPVIDHVYPLDEIVEAHRRVDSGRKRGNVVISLVRNGDK